MSSAYRPMSRMRKLEAKEALFRTRKRILRHLVHAFLKQEGFFRSAEVFAEEGQITSDLEVCDNIDLDIILQISAATMPLHRAKIVSVVTRGVSLSLCRDSKNMLFNVFNEIDKDYCSYYLMRFNKQPQFVRATEASARPTTTRRVRKTTSEPVVTPEPVKEPDLPASLNVTCLTRDEPEKESETLLIDQKPLAPLLVNASKERKQLVEMLFQEIIRPTGVTWDDVKGLNDAKSLLMESVVYPVRYPELFNGRVEPWRGVLLHGVPGCGKTRLARAAAACARCTFFNISPSTLVNKWRGDSEKIVKILFEMASYYAPSIIFIDEVETLASSTSANNHEASRRLKAQLLTELDGVKGRDGIVLLLANSNTPWDIDPAMLRRLEKRIHVPLPDPSTRTELFQMFLNAKNIDIYPKVDYQELASRTEGYSGSDIQLVCKEAIMSTVRKMLPTATGKSYQPNRKDKLHVSEILTAIDKTKPVAKHLAKRHEEWQRTMGCT